MKRVISIVIAIVMTAAFVTGCSTKTDNGTPSTNAGSTTVKSNVPSYMNETGYPIVKEKVTLKTTYMTICCISFILGGTSK